MYYRNVFYIWLRSEFRYLNSTAWLNQLTKVQALLTPTYRWQTTTWGSSWCAKRVVLGRVQKEN